MGKLPKLPYEEMKRAVLGEAYELSVTAVGRERSRTLNRAYRGIDSPTDVLSFPIAENAGEIIFNIEEAKKEARKFGRTFENFIAFLFIHALVHLKGLDHGKKMEEEEEKIRKKFHI